MEVVGKKLLVLSLAKHSFNENGNPVSYEPYVREMNLWSELFEQVSILTLIHPFQKSQKHNFAAFKNNNIQLIPIYSFDASKSFLHKFLHLISLPVVTFQFLFLIFKFDFINIRNSDFYSIILGILVRIFSVPSITKWAGSYKSFKGESFITKIDRLVINWKTKNHKVLIYDLVKKPQFVNFIPALMSLKEIAMAEQKSLSKPSVDYRLEIVAIGRLYWAKNFELIFEALQYLNKDKNVNFDWHFSLIGDGNLRSNLEKMSLDSGISNKVTFYGGMPFQEAQNILAKSHVLIMPGIMEGWPKPIAEAWAHNCFPIAANRGNVPHIISNSDKGICFEPNTKSLADAIKISYKYLSASKEKNNFNKYARAYSLEAFQEKLAKIIKDIR